MLNSWGHEGIFLKGRSWGVKELWKNEKNGENENV